MISSPIVPAIIPQSLVDLEEQLSRLGVVPEVHLDVVDGMFVPFTSWPYNSADDVPSSKVLLEAYTLEVDLMVNEPLKVASKWIINGADRLVFHSETISLIAFTQFVATTRVTVGIAASNDTSFEELEPYLAVADFVQVMGIAHIGVQGQPFDERALTRLLTLSNLYPRLPRSLDGSVNAGTLPDLMKLSLDRYIMGSAVMAAPDPHDAYLEFSKQARSSQQG